MNFKTGDKVRLRLDLDPLAVATSLYDLGSNGHANCFNYFRMHLSKGTIFEVLFFLDSDGSLYCKVCGDDSLDRNVLRRGWVQPAGNEIIVEES